MVQLDVATWTALGTWALVIGTLFLMWWQTRQAQELNSANSILTLRERFDAPRMRLERRQLSTHLLNGQHEDITSDEVGTFFELVGALTHRKVLSLTMVWEAFGSWITNYYYALRNPVDIIGRTRTDLRDPLVYHEFEWLNREMLRIDRRMLGETHLESIEKDEASRAILKHETTLDVS